MQFALPIAAIAALLGASGYFIDKSGEGVNDASNAALKLAVAGIGGYFVLKKVKVIK